MMEIRLRSVPTHQRGVAVSLVERYEREFMAKGREPGLRHAVVWSTESGYLVTYHTKTTIVVMPSSP